MQITASRALLFVLVGCAPVASGCYGGSSRIAAADVNPSRLSSQLMAELDTDGNGALSEAETAPLPPLYNSRSAYDTDGDGAISAAELEARLAKIFRSDVGVITATCRVTRNGRPLEGAAVYFVPPKALEDFTPVASGVTDADGITGLRLAKEDIPANFPNPNVAIMRPGIYLVEVTHPSLEIPPKFNKQTELGKEVFSEVTNGPPLAIDLRF